MQTVNDDETAEAFEKWFSLKYPAADADDREIAWDIWRNAVSWAKSAAKIAGQLS